MTSDVSGIETRKDRAQRLLDRTTSLASPGTSLRIARAPGRVNLIGEHTDHNEGWVLPVAIDLDVWLAFAESDLDEVRLESVQLAESGSFGLRGLAPERRVPGWLGYVAGTAWAMQEAGVPVRGLNGILDSTIPVGAGLSSSAAIELVSSVALDASPPGTRPGPARMATIGQRAENRYVGVNCGIMDQYASAAGRAGHALLIDCRSLEATHVPLPEDLTLVVCDTASPHKLETSAYNERRAQCEEAVRIIAEREPGVRTLRDVDSEMLARNLDRMPDVIARRARHVVAEDERVLEAVAALRADDRETLGRLFAAAHNSMRDLFEASSPELDALVEIATPVPGVVAARMTGGGFGGCTVNLVERGAEDRLAAEVLRRYPERTGLTPRIYIVDAVDGAGFVQGIGGLA